MSNALKFFGGLVQGYEGYKAGVAENEKKADADYERTLKRDKDAYDTEVRNADRELLPTKTEAAKVTAQSDLARAKAQAEMLPQEVALKKTQLEREIFNATIQAAGNPALEGKAREDVFSTVGRYIASGDVEGTNIAMAHLAKSPLFPGMAKLGDPVKTEFVEAKGEPDISGSPLTGPALRITSADGSVNFVSPQRAIEAYRRRQIEADSATAKPLKPGDKLVTQSGRVIAEGNEKPYGGGLVQDEDGNWVRVPGLGGAGGTGTGKGGKAPATPAAQAADAFEFAAKNAETKLTPNQLAYGSRVAQQLGTNPQIPPAIAAEVAVEVATDPTKIQPKVNVQTGKVEGVFSRKDLGDIVVEPWSPAYQRSVTPEQLKKAAEEFVKAQPAEVQTQLVEAAHSPDARAKLEKSLTDEIAKNYQGEQAAAVTKSTMASLSEKLDMLAKNTAPPKKPGENRSIRERLSNIGGLSRAPAAPVDPNSPAGRAQARRAEQAEQREAKQAEAAKAKQDLSAQFQKDKAELDPLALAQKYDALRGDLPTADAAELQRIERNIR